MKFGSRKLYGGALVADIPENYYDVSDVRQVPDTQEVFQEREGIHNVIVDILEHVGHITDPLEAARYHLEDYVDGDGDLTVWTQEKVELPHISKDASAVSLLATTARKDGKSTAIFLILIRLDKHATDLLVTTNIHNVSTGDAKEYDALFKDQADADLQAGREITEKFIESFEIKDYKLFHPEEA